MIILCLISPNLNKKNVNKTQVAHLPIGHFSLGHYMPNMPFENGIGQVLRALVIFFFE